MYIINNKTLYLATDGYNTKIYEQEKGEFYSEDNIDTILNCNCIYYGSSLKGRQQGSKDILKIHYKLPIIVSEANNIILFSIKINNNILWFNFKNISNYQRNNNNLLVKFVNGKEELFNISYTIFNNQVLKCSKLWFTYLNRANM